MVNGFKTIYHRDLNEGFSSSFFVGFLVWHETSKEGRRAYRSKLGKYNSEDEDKCPNMLSDKECERIWLRIVSWS